MSFPCSENTVLVNATHKIQSQLQQTNPTLVATIPTPKLENIFGYDTAFESWKIFLCQYKRPYYYKQRFYYYYLNMIQNWKLHFWWQHFASPCAFYPLVLTMSDQHLAQINPSLLDHVIFVDAMSVWPLSTIIRVEKTLGGRLTAKYKIWHGPWVVIPYLYSWNDIELGIKSCDIGGRMKYRGEITESNRLLRETASSLRENVLPSWLRGRTEAIIRKRFEERSSSQFFDFTNKVLIENRERKRPTTIVSPSFKAFIYPMSI